MTDQYGDEPQQPQQQQQPYQQQYQPQQYQQQQYYQPQQPQQPQYQQGDFYHHQAKAQGQGIQAMDSLSSNEFIVEIASERVAGVFAVTGLSSYSLKLEDGKPVGLEYPPLVVTKMVQQDATLQFNQWTRETVAARGTRLPTRDISIVAMDEGVETRRWIYRNCWISSIEFSDFDSDKEFLIEERITIQHGGVEEVWPG
ncbi:MAG: phage tail protein [Chloroflexi bacterium]|nr:phage tail protein [Chloroflexota bacterium]